MASDTHLQNHFEEMLAAMQPDIKYPQILPGSREYRVLRMVFFGGMQVPKKVIEACLSPEEAAEAMVSMANEAAAFNREVASLMTSRN